MFFIAFKYAACSVGAVLKHDTIFGSLIVIKNEGIQSSISQRIIKAIRKFHLSSYNEKLKMKCLSMRTAYRRQLELEKLDNSTKAYISSLIASVKSYPNSRPVCSPQALLKPQNHRTCPRQI